MIRIIRLSDREKALFQDLYSLKLLSANQIARAYYKNSNYGYRRIRELNNEGYLDSKPLVIGRKKITQYYFLMDKAIKELNIDNPRKAHKNFIKAKHLVERQIAINEIYISLLQAHQQHGKENIWAWEDSRESKENYDLNRGSLIAGVLANTKTDAKYNIYLPNQRVDMMELSDRMHTEIDKNESVRNNIILCTSKEIFQYYLENFKFAGRSTMILPHAEGINIIYNALYDYDAWLKKIIAEALNSIPSMLTKEYQPYADYSTDEYYIAELLTTDIVKLHFIGKYSSDDKADKLLKIICWDTQMANFLKKNIKNTNKKISFYPLQWENAYILNSIDRTLVYRPTTIEKLKPSEKTKSISISLGPKTYKFIRKRYPHGTRSEFIENLIINSEDYRG